MKKLETYFIYIDYYLITIWSTKKYPKSTCLFAPGTSNKEVEKAVMINNFFFCVHRGTQFS